MQTILTSSIICGDCKDKMRQYIPSESIDWKKSAELNKVDEDDLKLHFDKYPKANKNVIAICKECGKEREIRFCQYRDMCPKCARNLPEARAENSRTRNKFFKTHPEAREAARAKSIAQFSNPAARDKMSEILNNSPAIDKMRGGDDIVEHHVAYDFLSPKEMTVEITRTFHGKIHHPKGCKFGTYGYSLID
jgi:hypothetical protein